MLIFISGGLSAIQQPCSSVMATQVFGSFEKEGCGVVKGNNVTYVGYPKVEL